MFKTIGVVGNGVVGNATARAFMEHAEVRCYDINPMKRTHPLDAVLGCDVVFLCLPTPQTAGLRKCDTSVIDGFLLLLSETGRWKDANLVLRSTVPIGYTRHAARFYGLPNLVHSPEFLTARCAVTDAQLPARNIVGTSVEGSVLNGLKLSQLYHTRFPGVPCLTMTSDESEAVKLFLNGFFAVKVAYWNEVNRLAAAKGLDWNLVMRGVLSDGRVAHSHTKVPGPDGKYGFGGECLPKDLNNLIACFSAAELDADLLVAADANNARDRERPV